MSSFADLFNKYAIPLDGMRIATEADDVTQTVARQMGGSNAPTNQDTEERYEDLTQTDNIFADAHEGDEDRPPQPDTDEDDLESSDPDADDETEDDPEAEGEESSEDDAEDPDASTDIESEDDMGSEEAPESVYSDKNTLRDNMVYFANTLRTDIDELTNALGEMNDLDSIQVVNSVMFNLRNCKDVLHKTITDELELSSYESLVRKYITVKRIYDISIEMLDKHFSNAKKKPIRRRSKRTLLRV